MLNPPRRHRWFSAPFSKLHRSSVGQKHWLMAAHQKINLHKALLSTRSLRFRNPDFVPQLQRNYTPDSQTINANWAASITQRSWYVWWNLNRTWRVVFFRNELPRTPHDICMQRRNHCTGNRGNNNLTNIRDNDVVKLPDSYQYRVSGRVPTHISCFEPENRAQMSVVRVDR